MKAEAETAYFKSLLERATHLVFDFDGTLVDSNAIKLYGFEYAFRDFSDRLNEIMAYCRGSNHTIRGEKFRYVYEQILKAPYTAEIDRLLHDRYASATTQAVIRANEIPGAAKFLSHVSQGFETAVLSSTPHEILPQILEQRGWRRFFRLLQGAPVNKSMWLDDLKQKHRLQSSDILFFGDTREDLDASRSAQCIFIGVNNPKLADEADCYISDFANLV